MNTITKNIFKTLNTVPFRTFKLKNEGIVLHDIYRLTETLDLEFYCKGTNTWTTTAFKSVVNILLGDYEIIGMPILSDKERTFLQAFIWNTVTRNTTGDIIFNSGVAKEQHFVFGRGIKYPFKGLEQDIIYTKEDFYL